MLRVVYEQSAIFNPQGLVTDDTWTPEAQILFLTRCSHATQENFVNGAHKRALLENAEFDFAAGPKLAKLEDQLSDDET